VSELDVLVENLMLRRHEGIVVPYSPLWPNARYGHCHNNVCEFLANNEGYRGAGAWLVHDIDQITGGLLPFVQFVPHSIVRDSAGALHDITPWITKPLIVHEGGNFLQFVTEHKIERLEQSLPCASKNPFAEPQGLLLNASRLTGLLGADLLTACAEFFERAPLGALASWTPDQRSGMAL
jgi:hypothetical protein